MQIGPLEIALPAQALPPIAEIKDIIQLMPSDGWAAIFNSIDQNCAAYDRIVKLVGWAIVREESKDIDRLTSAYVHVVRGLVNHDRYLIDAARSPDFVRFIYTPIYPYGKILQSFSDQGFSS